MMEEIFELVGKIRVDMSGLDSAFKNIENKTNQVGQNFKNVGNSMASFGGSMTAKVTAPILAAGAAAVKIGSDFEQGMSKVEAMTQATDTEMKKLEETARDLGKSTQFSAKEAADGMSFLAMA